MKDEFKGKIIREFVGLKPTDVDHQKKRKESARML